jgi:hypothetical protein
MHIRVFPNLYTNIHLLKAVYGTHAIISGVFSIIIKRAYLLHECITRSLMEPRPSWEAASCAATHGLPSNLWNWKAHYGVHKSPPLVSILSQINAMRIYKYISAYTSRDSSVGIATGYGLDDQGGGGSSSPVRVKNFHFSISSRLALGSTQPPIKWVPGSSSPGVKRQGREADHSPPTSAEVKETWIYTSTSSYAFMV